jgi:lysine decarboxylase
MMHGASMPASTASPIVRVLNRDVGRYHRWCTPSILPDQERVEDFYASDIWISAGFFGTLVDHTHTAAIADAVHATSEHAIVIVDEARDTSLQTLRVL